MASSRIFSFTSLPVMRTSPLFWQCSIFSTGIRQAIIRRSISYGRIFPRVHTRSRSSSPLFLQRVKSSKSFSKKSSPVFVSLSLLSTPFLFTTYDAEPAPMSELIFLAGKSISFCVERLLENEVGNSVFMFLLFLSYFALIGKEGSLYGFAFRLKYRYGTNFKAVCHPRYMHSIPPNPLLKKL
ncbi:hypothetical protein IE077_000370 [Cardiosporidium cionae]|uniref:Microprotein domain-containing protein n=1 Tax=Cardiosporidium cionae TaxID=476202 RepID=A0ABQ7JAI8_9APIC|nr:hypothetical protein IE077_000370 [Cardiosporidium cionae]|eukprot:KAF8821002.1 hypothetical protein IE077_000370 [Cardiosporidium cionae]